MRQVAGALASAALLAAQGLEGPPLRCLSSPAPGTGQPQLASASPSPTLVEFSALDAAGGAVSDLTPADVVIKTDGQVRKIVSLRYVFRGPGAATAAKGAQQRAALAEPARTVLLAVDVPSIARGKEEELVGAVWAVLDQLAPADRVALVTLPLPSGRAVLSTDREPLTAAVARLAARSALPGHPPPVAMAMDADDLRDLSVSDEVLDRERQAGGGDRQQGVTPNARPANERSAGTDLHPAARPAEARPPEAARASSLAVLARLLEDLGRLPGLKHVVYVWGGAQPATPAEAGDAADAGSQLRAVVDAAAPARARVHLVYPLEDRRRSTSRDLERLARDTGGVTDAPSPTRPQLLRLAAALSGSYVAELGPLPGDRDGRAHALAVASTHKVVTMVAPHAWVARDDLLPAAPAVPAASGISARDPAVPSPGARGTGAAGAAPAARTRSRVTPGSRGPAKPDPELDAALARVAEYLDGYMRDFSNIVAEENYEQRVGLGTGSAQTRRLRSDLLMVQTEGPDGWVPFRDVFEVDGRPVRDRQDRLRTLFLENPEQALKEGRRITEEGARYNIGNVFRTLNLPTLALVFLMPAHRGGFSFERHGLELLDAMRLVRLDYEEVGRPTVIRQADTDRDMPATGSLWLDPATGRIVRTLVRTSDGMFSMEMTVTYRRSEALGIWVPAEMKEAYIQRASQTISGSAKYSNFRRFQVKTEEKIAIPK